MGMILNGIALEGLTRPYGGTFLVFSDYMRPAVRLAAIQQVPVTFVWTHDSIGLGEDGPTHQPIEHLAALRAMPGLDVVRPADANETAQAWAEILRRGRPAGLALSRQNLPIVDRTEHAKATGVAKGAYVLIDAASGAPDVVLVATGSEVLAGPRGPPAPGEGRRRHPRRLDAVPGVVRGAAALLPEQGPAALGARPRQRRGGRGDGVARPRRRLRPLHQHRALRRLGGRRRPCSASSVSPPRRSSRPPRTPSRRPATATAVPAVTDTAPRARKDTGTDVAHHRTRRAARARPRPGSEHDDDQHRPEGPRRQRRLHLARRPVPRAPHLGQPPAAHRRQGGRRRHDEPVDLPGRPVRGARLRRPGPRARGCREDRRRGRVRPHDPGRARRVRRLPARSTRPPAARTAGCRSRSTRGWPTTPPGRSRRPRPSRPPSTARTC